MKHDMEELCKEQTKATKLIYIYEDWSNEKGLKMWTNNTRQKKDPKRNNWSLYDYHWKEAVHWESFYELISKNMPQGHNIHNYTI